MGSLLKYSFGCCLLSSDIRQTHSQFYISLWAQRGEEDWLETITLTYKLCGLLKNVKSSFKIWETWAFRSPEVCGTSPPPTPLRLWRLLLFLLRQDIVRPLSFGSDRTSKCLDNLRTICDVSLQCHITLKLLRLVLLLSKCDCFYVSVFVKSNVKHTHTHHFSISSYIITTAVTWKYTLINSNGMLCLLDLCNLCLLDLCNFSVPGSKLLSYKYDIFRIQSLVTGHSFHLVAEHYFRRMMWGGLAK